MTPVQQHVIDVLTNGGRLYVIDGYGGRTYDPRPPSEFGDVSMATIKALLRRKLVKRKVKEKRWLEYVLAQSVGELTKI